MLDPTALSAIHDLEFVARVTVDGALAGLHRSPFHGYSAEFSQYRHYRRGDDLKYVDWKLFARTDRLYSRQFRESTNVRMQVLLDASASMAFRGEAPAAKIDYGRWIAGALARLLSTQGDAAGLTVFDEHVRTHIGSRTGQAHLHGILTALTATAAAGGTSSARALRRGVDRLDHRGIVVVISDLYDDEAALATELRRAARMGHDVTVFHVLTRDELEWPWRGPVELEDSETGRRVLASPATAERYRERMRQFVTSWRERCTADGILYVLATTDVPPARTLRDYLFARTDRSSR